MSSGIPAQGDLSARDWVDGHCHLADLRLASTIDRVMDEASRQGIRRFIQGGVDPEDWSRQQTLAKRFPGQVFCTYGLHPWFVAAHDDSACSEAYQRLESEFARSPEARGLGELGLDSRRAGERGLVHQERWMESQLELAQRLRLPLVVHVVDAHVTALEVLRRHAGPAGRYAHGGIIHSFSGTEEQGQAYIDLGFFLSVSGVLARKGFERLKRAVVKLPSESIVIESDSPDQPPERLRGNLNHPDSLWDTARELGRIQGLDPCEILERSTRRLEKLFRL